MDYTSGLYTVTFPAGVTSAPFSIPINNDYALEDEENFMLTINPSSLPTGVTRSNDSGQATVTIVDNACKLHYVYDSAFAMTSSWLRHSSVL